MDLKIYLTEELKNKLDIISCYTESEVAGWLTGEVKEGKIILDDILIPKQDASSGDVELKPNGTVELRKEFKNRCSRILGHFHTHPRMGTFWSITDESNMDAIVAPRNFFIFIVGSERKYLIKIELNNPFRISFDKVPFTVVSKENNKLKEEMLELIKQRVEKPKITFTQTSQLKEKPGVTYSGLRNVRYSLRQRKIYVESVNSSESEYLCSLYQTLNSTFYFSGYTQSIEFDVSGLSKKKIKLIANEMQEELDCLRESNPNMRDLSDFD